MEVSNVFQHARFLMSVNEPADLPPPHGREVAFAGRSNAGKSSAINALALRNKLAFVSKTPGRTQQINFFDLGDDRYLVDLPGYGYAAVPLAVKRHWEVLLSDYIATRQSLCGLVVIMDVRHPLTTLDQQLLEWAHGAGIPVHILLTKCDKLTRQHASKALKEVEAQLAATSMTCGVQLFSSTEHTGLDTAQKAVQALLDGPQPPDGP